VDACLRGQQRQEGFVLRLGEPTEGRRRAGAAIPRPAPHRRDQLSVVGISPIDLDDKGVAVVVDRVDQEHSGGLTFGDAQRMRDNAQAAEAGRHVGETGPSQGRAECEAYRGSTRTGRGKRARRTRHRSGEVQDRAEEGEKDQPVGEPAGRSPQLRRDAQQRAGREGKRQRRIVNALAARSQ
jgi:hypothetical protein